MAATLDRFRTIVTVGNMNAMQPARGQRRGGELVVGRAEAVALLGLADEGPHHPHAGDLLPQHLVHAVDALLHEPELRDHPGDHEADADEQDGDADEQQEATGRRPPGRPG